jgi:hypothetical protein
MTTLEDLNRNQVVLLVILISFVSSVATGIITTALLAQAPVNVTNTINRVVEHTIEKVTPTTGKEISLNKEDKALLAAVSKAADVVVRIHEVTPLGMATSSVQGVIVTKEGLVISKMGNIAEGKSYVGVLSDNTKLSLALATTSPSDNLAIFRIVTPATAQ